MKRGAGFGIFLALFLFGFISFVSSAGVIIQGESYACDADTPDQVCPLWYGVDCGTVEDADCSFGEVLSCEDYGDNEDACLADTSLESQECREFVEGCFYDSKEDCLWDDFTGCYSDFTEGNLCTEQSDPSCAATTLCDLDSLDEEDQCSTEGFILLKYTYKAPVDSSCLLEEQASCPETFNLSFFDWRNLLLVIVIIVAVYYFMHIGKKSKRK